MYRGTTPTLKFILPFDAGLLKEAWITLGQDNEEIVNKTLSDCTTDGTTLSVLLTQSDTLALSHEYRTYVQLRVLLTDGTALASKTFKMRTNYIIRNGVIS